MVFSPILISCVVFAGVCLAGVYTSTNGVVRRKHRAKLSKVNQFGFSMVINGHFNYILSEEK